MESKILQYLKEHKGARVRYMVGALGISRVDLVKELARLEREGAVKSTLHMDMANMECYNSWDIV